MRAALGAPGWVDVLDRRVLGQPGDTAAVRVHRVDLYQASWIAAEGSIAAEGDLGAVRRPAGMLVAPPQGVGESGPTGAVRHDHEDPVTGFKSDFPATAPSGCSHIWAGVRDGGDPRAIGVHDFEDGAVEAGLVSEYDSSAVRRPSRAGLAASAEERALALDREPGEAGASHVHDINRIAVVKAAAARAHKRDLLAIGRPGGLQIIRRVVGQPGGGCAVRVHHPNLPITRAGALERDFLAVGRPG